ncbi:MAG TPA: asparaginase [Gemmatimonadaceae bacterium]|jgi:L-asparaginase|nr:asparaginase [Gemmatimonadaceae bacterium]
MIPLVFTGGTISMRTDPASGGAVPTLSGQAILASAPGVATIADVIVEEWATMPGAHLTVPQLWALRSRLAELVARDDVDGVVVAQGTDTIEESAYLTHRSLGTDKPIVFTGAMRTSEDDSWDGPANLTDAVRAAASPAMRGAGVLVAFNGRVYTAADVTKVETFHVDAFDSPGLGPIATMDAGCVVVRRRVAANRPPIIPANGPGSPVDIIYASAGADDRLLDTARATARGVVVAAFGRGNLPFAMYEGVRRCLGDGLPVVITSRVQRGRVGPTYGFPGGGRSLADAGAILAGALRPQQARIDLMLALGAGLSGERLAAVFEL